MYVSWKGLLGSTLLGAGIGAGVGFTQDKTAMGAGIGAAAGLALPLGAEFIEGMFDKDRAAAVTAMKKLRSAVAAHNGDDQAKYQDEMDNATLAMVNKANETPVKK